MSKLSIHERDAHLRAVIKSNLVGTALDAEAIEAITQNIYLDFLDVISNFNKLREPDLYVGE